VTLCRHVCRKISASVNWGAEWRDSPAQTPELGPQLALAEIFICNNHFIYTTVAQEFYNRDRSQEVDDVEGLAVAATKHLELLKQKDEPESSFILEDSNE
jgi:hypothetical protein